MDQVLDNYCYNINQNDISGAGSFNIANCYAEQCHCTFYQYQNCGGGLKRLVTSMVMIVQKLELCWLNLNLFDAFFTDIVFINTKFHIIVLEKMKFNNQTIRSPLGPAIRGRGRLDLAFE